MTVDLSMGSTVASPAGYTEDAEIQAIRGCVAHLNKLDAETRGRVARYLASRYAG